MFLSEVKQIWLRQTTDDVYSPSCHFLFSDLFAMHELNQDTFIMLNDVDSDAYKKIYEIFSKGTLVDYYTKQI